MCGPASPLVRSISLGRSDDSRPRAGACAKMARASGPTSSSMSCAARRVTRDVTQRALRPVTKDDDGSAKVLVDNILDYAVFLLDLDGTVKSWPTRRNPKNRTPPRPKCPPTFRRGTRLENAALAVLRSGSTGSEHAAFIEAERVKGRNATALYQDIVEHHAYDGSYDAVKRVARRIRPRMAAIQAGCQVLDREAHVLFEELVLADAIGERASANR